MSPSATASSAQVREKIHTKSVGRWRDFEIYLAPLKDALEKEGIPLLQESSGQAQQISVKNSK